MAESLENKGKLRKLIDNFQFAELSKSEFAGLTRYRKIYRNIINGQVAL